MKDLEVYQIARELSRDGWGAYRKMKNEHRFSLGQQFMGAIDSIGANIAEGFGRYHYLDSAKFYYNARGSLWESKHWLDLLRERSLITPDPYGTMSEHLDLLGVKLNNFIASVKAKARNDNK